MTAPAPDDATCLGRDVLGQLAPRMTAWPSRTSLAMLRLSDKC